MLGGCTLLHRPAPVIADAPVAEAVPAPPSELDELIHDLDPGRMPPLADLDWGFASGMDQGQLISQLVLAWQTRFIFANSLLAWDNQARERGELGRLAILSIAQMQRDRENGRGCTLPCQDALMRSYAYYGSMRYLDQPEIIERLIDGFGWRGEMSPERTAALATFLQLIIAESPARLRAVAVDVLRVDPEGPYGFHALSLLSVSEAQAGNYALAVRLNKQIVLREGDTVTAEELITAAEACYRVPDYACAKAYIERATSMSTPPTLDDLAEVAVKSAAAASIDAVANPTSYGERLYVADLEDDLGRLGEAGAHYRQLTTEAPDDARAFVGLMWNQAHNSGWPKLFELLADAGRQNRPAGFERLALSMWFAGAIASVHEKDPARRAPFIKDAIRVQAMLHELATHEPETAGMLALLVDAGTSVASADHDKLIHALLDSTASQDSGNELVGRARLILAALESDSKHASSVIADVMRKHRDQPSIIAQRRSTLLQRAVMWNDSVSLETLARAKTLDAQTLVDIHAMKAADKKAWAKVASEYKALPAAADDYESRRRVNNMNVALFHAGAITEPPPRSVVPAGDRQFASATPAKNVIIDRTFEAAVNRDAPAFITALAVDARPWLIVE
jgi:tetratricopeptide (TPR) repeat protein